MTIISVDFYETPEELRATGEFLLNAADKLDNVQASNLPLNIDVELGNSNPYAQVDVSINAFRHVDE